MTIVTKQKYFRYSKKYSIFRTNDLQCLNIKALGTWDFEP